MRFRSNFARSGIAATVVTLVAILASAGQANALPTAPYGEVARLGGFDTGASYSTTGTTGLPEKEDELAKLVYPIGMAVDDEDPSAPDKYAIYVLENINPQALNAAENPAPSSVSLEYRIQKISDSGTILAVTKFTLTSTSSEPALHAVSLAVDGPAERVYVLMMDVPPISENSEQHSAVDAIDAWTTELKPAVGLKTGIKDDLPEDSRTHGGELVGSSVLQGSGSNGFLQDMDGAGIAVYGTGAAADLALGGNQYTSAEHTTPVIELVKTTEAGHVEASPWAGSSDIAATEDAAAKAAKQNSKFLYSLSTNPNHESLNVSFGRSNVEPKADLEPNMATVSGNDLSTTTAILPGSIVSQNFVTPTPATQLRYNEDVAATTGFNQDVGDDGSFAFMPPGATPGAGTLAPSVVQLAGGGSFPAEAYAGVVAHVTSDQFYDAQNPAESLYSWKFAEAEINGAQERKIVKSASLGVRVFNSSGEPLAMIGSATAGGACSIESSPSNPINTFVQSQPEGNPSFVALAPGREGVVFALVQPDLVNADGTSSETIDPANAVGATEGDQIIEFAPGPDSTGAGSNELNWKECPQPEGGFSITPHGGSKSAGTGEVAVPAGTTVAFGSEVNLRGGSPWAYDWELQGGEPELLNDEWTVGNTFTLAPESGKAWLWPLSTSEAEFKKPGTYTETLKLVNDFGTLISQRTLRVVASGKPEEVKVAVSSGATEGEAVTLKASAKLPAGDKIKDYRWEFGDGEIEDTGEGSEAQHVYAAAGSYKVKLKVTDALGQEGEGEERVSIGVKSTTTTTKTTTQSTTTTTTATTAPTTTTTSHTTTVTKTSTTKSSESKTKKLAAALKLCKKDKAKKKRQKCERAARAKFGPKPKKKHAKKK